MDDKQFVSNQILQFLDKNYEEKLNAMLAAQESINKASKPEHRSTEMKDLFAALAKAQSEMETAGLHSTNPYFKSKYADLATIVNASRPCLTKNGLSVIQQILTNEDGATVLHTILCHNSGQWIETRMRVVPPKNDVQTIGSYITYLRRYSYAALVGVVAADDDDDGESAVATSRETFAKGTALNTKYTGREESPEVITKEQLEDLEYELSQFPDLAEDILDKMRLQSLADLPKKKFNAAITRVREIKNARNGIK